MFLRKSLWYLFLTILLIILFYPDNSAAQCSGANFAAPINFDVDGLPTSILVEDFNGDGNPDLAISDGSIFLGDGTGGFTYAGNFAGGNYMVAGDFNNDGNLDLITANPGNLSISLGSGTGSFSPALNFGAGTNPSSIA